jgi:hypothetical protein
MASRSLTTRAIAHIDGLIDVVQPSQYLVDGFDSVSEPQDYRLKRCLDRREPLSDADEPEDHVIQKNALIAFIALDFYGHIRVTHSKEHMAAIAGDLGWHSSEHLRRIIDHYANRRLAYLGNSDSRYIPGYATNLARKLCYFVDQYRLCRAKPGPMTESRKKEFNQIRLVWQKAYRETPRALLEGDLELPAILNRQMHRDQPRNKRNPCATSGASNANIPMGTGGATSQNDQELLLRGDLASVLQNNPQAVPDRRRSPSPRNRSRSPRRLPAPFHTRVSRSLAYDETPQATRNAAPATGMYDSYCPTAEFVHPARRALMKPQEPSK